MAVPGHEARGLTSPFVFVVEGEKSADALTTLGLVATCSPGGAGKSRLASEAKLFTGETAVFCSERGVQIHGGYGFIKDYRAEKYYRDAKICTIGEGTSEIQRLVIARQLLKRR